MGVTAASSSFTVAPARFAPVIVTIVPPAIGPCEGEMLSIRCCANAAAQVRATTREVRTMNVRRKPSRKQTVR
jgi:hypothetical protein